MDHPLQINRTVDDIADATVVAMEATGAWARNVTTTRWCIALLGTMIGLAGAIAVSDWAFAVIVLIGTAAAIAHGIWRAPDRLKRSYRKRVPQQLGLQLQGGSGLRTLWITDAGLSDSGSGISTTIAWDRITHYVATPRGMSSAQGWQRSSRSRGAAT